MPTRGHRIPLNTYRLQLHAGFTFADATARLDYLVELGITDLYLSPILESVPGSAHGYDVVDPTRVSEERGGRAGFEALATAAHALGLGVIVDIVPNHMAIPTPLWLNPPLWSALRDGPESPYADWFDIEPDARLVLPNIEMDERNCAQDRSTAPSTPATEASSAQFLPPDDPIPALIASGRLGFDELRHPDGGVERVLTLDGQPYPLAPDTAGLPLAEAAAAQRYALRRWEGNHTRLTHRRFFDIVTLIGVHQELPEVFRATHALLLELFHAGHIDGFRVDHPDGLADPQAYFEQLREATGGAWVVAEKILSGDELLPPSWPVAGTTGYEASWRFDAVQISPAGATPLTRLAQTTDERPAQTWPEVATEAKRLIADGSLAIDLDRLTRLALLLDPNLDAVAVQRSLREFLVALDRYRAYVRPGHPTSAADARVLADAARRAAGVLGERDLPTLERLHALAGGQAPGPQADEFAIRFQQVSGALVAKGVEDTAFYRWTQLLTLCEVGGDPDAFGLTPDELHAWLARVNDGWPATMSLGSTHDSKRSEDVRARIAAISEYPEEWAGLVRALTPLVPALPAPSRTTLWQTLAGTWTPGGPIDPDRIAAYLVKAGREQKLWTSWVAPDNGAEAAAAGVVPELLADPGVRQAFDGWSELTSESVRTNTLATKLVQLTALGTADTYQGQETVRLSLTDPDNRRAVDFEALRRLLAVASGELPRGLAEDARPTAHVPDRLHREKLALTHLALALRKRHPEAFVAGAYRPLESNTEFAWGFARGDEPTTLTIATRLPRLRAARGGWQPAHRLTLPPGGWRNLLTGSEHRVVFHPATDLAGWPVALMERIG